MPKKTSNPATPAAEPASELPQEVRQRAMGSSLGANIMFPTAGRTCDGKLFRARLSSAQAFGSLWDVDGEAIATLRALKGIPAFGDLPVLLCLDFLTRECTLFSLNAGLLCCAEDELLHGASRGAFLRAFSLGARRIDTLGFARCDPPSDWIVKSLNPRNVSSTISEILRLIVQGSLAAGDAKAWVDACKPMQSHAGDLLSLAFSLHERALIQAESANSNSNSNSNSIAMPAILKIRL